MPNIIGPRTTTDSKTEGRLKVDAGSFKKKKHKLLRETIKNIINMK